MIAFAGRWGVGEEENSEGDGWEVGRDFVGVGWGCAWGCGWEGVGVAESDRGGLSWARLGLTLEGPGDGEGDAERV